MALLMTLAELTTIIRFACTFNTGGFQYRDFEISGGGQSQNPRTNPGTQIYSLFSDKLK